MDHKEILTDEHIKEDLKDFQKWYYLVPASIGILLAGVLLWCSFPIKILFILFLFSEALLVACLIRDIVAMIRYRRAYKSGDFVVKKNVLHAKSTPIHFIILYFFNYKSFHMPTGKRYYKWSEMYCLTQDGIWLYSEINDTFYIVTADGKTPLMVYNTKLFEYNGDKKEGNST